MPPTPSRLRISYGPRLVPGSSGMVLSILLVHATLLPRGQKFIAGVPGGQFGRVGHVDADQQPKLCVLLHARKIPIFVIFVGGLVIILVDKLLVQFMPGSGWLAD